jgi:hypothetical protein
LLVEPKDITSWGSFPGLGFAIPGAKKGSLAAVSFAIQGVGNSPKDKMYRDGAPTVLAPTLYSFLNIPSLGIVGVGEKKGAKLQDPARDPDQVLLMGTTDYDRERDGSRTLRSGEKEKADPCELVTGVPSLSSKREWYLSFVAIWEKGNALKQTERSTIIGFTSNFPPTFAKVRLAGHRGTTEYKLRFTAIGGSGLQLASRAVDRKKDDLLRDLRSLDKIRGQGDDGEKGILRLISDDLLVQAGQATGMARATGTGPSPTGGGGGGGGGSGAGTVVGNSLGGGGGGGGFGVPFPTASVGTTTSPATTGGSTPSGAVGSSGGGQNQPQSGTQSGNQTQSVNLNQQQQQQQQQQQSSSSSGGGNVVPEPPTALLALLGLPFLCFFLLRRKPVTNGVTG